MLLHCLGTTGYHPCERRHTACYFVPEAGLVLDAGSGLFRLTPLIQTDQLDILISHAHLDHVVGLTYLLEVMYRRPLQAVRVWGEAEKLDAIRRHLFHELLFPVLPQVTWHALEEQAPTIEGGGQVRWFPLPHPGGSVGYRIDWPDRSLAYVTDTVADPAADYVGIIRDADLLLHECYFRDNQAEWAEKTGHSWTTRAAQVGQAAAVRQLALVHINPMDGSNDPVEIAVAAAIHPRCVVAEDGMVLEF